jgi:hypothetical protein
VTKYLLKDEGFIFSSEFQKFQPTVLVFADSGHLVRQNILVVERVAEATHFSPNGKESGTLSGRSQGKMQTSRLCPLVTYFLRLAVISYFLSPPQISTIL